MSDKFRNKYRIASVRLKHWDYGWDGAYFITICTANRQHFFGEIENGKMILSSTGVIADILWYEIPNHNPFVTLGDFVVMPNHVHGILILNKPNDDKRGAAMVETLHVETLRVETLHATSLQPPLAKNDKMAIISPKSHSVSTIIRSYKSAVTKHANRLGFRNGWQPRFYDHIIRDQTSFQNISAYIKNNPGNWPEDRFFK